MIEVFLLKKVWLLKEPFVLLRRLPVARRPARGGQASNSKPLRP